MLKFPENHKRVLIYSTGTEDGVNPLFESLIRELLRIKGIEIQVVSNHLCGGVHSLAIDTNLAQWWFHPIDNVITEINYQFQIDEFKPDLIIFCDDWDLPIHGIDPRKTVLIKTEQVDDSLNIRLGFVLASASNELGPIVYSVSTGRIDPEQQVVGVTGAIIQLISPLQFVLREQISWDGVNHDSLKVPPGYKMSFV